MKDAESNYFFFDNPKAFRTSKCRAVMGSVHPFKSAQT